MTKDDPADPIRKEAGLIETGLTLQSQGLDLLLAEMHALAGLLAGSSLPGSPQTARTEAETEADFDNMPV